MGVGQGEEGSSSEGGHWREAKHMHRTFFFSAIGGMGRNNAR